MKRINLFSVLCTAILALLVTSCHNQDAEFPDFGRTTVYFAYQFPVRTIVLGDDTYDTSLDNAHQCQIYATMGGVYANKKKIDIDFSVDNSLCNNLLFTTGGAAVKAMPSNYYTLSGNKISLDHSLMGCVGVQLTDAFFADPLSLQNTYVIPLRMTKVANADSILSGIPKVANAARANSALWDVQPKDFVLYCVKFINQYHANYLRRGKDVITLGSATTTNIRHNQYVEKDEVCSTSTVSLNAVQLPIKVVDGGGNTVACTLLLTFDSQGKCTVSSATTGFTATGTGMFVKNGEKKSWGNVDRSAIYLNYNITMGASGKSYQTNDTLVVRDRGVKMETFLPVNNN